MPSHRCTFWLGAGLLAGLSLLAGQPARANHPREDLGEAAISITRVVVYYNGGNTVRVNGTVVRRADLARYLTRILEPMGGPAKVPVTLFVSMNDISPAEFISVNRQMMRMDFPKFNVIQQVRPEEHR